MACNYMGLWILENPVTIQKTQLADTCDKCHLKMKCKEKACDCSSKKRNHIRHANTAFQKPYCRNL